MSILYDEPHYQLLNGKFIADAEISAKMQRIHDRHPEKEFQEDSTGYTWDERGMADLFAECYKDDTRYCTEARCWYTYDGISWVQDTDALLVSAKIREFTRLLSLYCAEIEDDETRTAYTKFCAKLGDRRYRDRIRKDAESCMQISRDEFDTNPYLINCLNGTWDMDEMCFREHDWRDFITHRTRFRYALNGLDYECPRWRQFIDEVCEHDEDKADYLQRALGYSLLGVAKEECMFILHGKTTRNGKSTLLNTIHHMLGDYAGVARVELICHTGKSGDANAATPELADLRGKRFVTMAESDTAGKLDESAIKQYTGGEQVRARQLYEHAFSFTPQFTLWLSCNDLPAVRDQSLFASDRLRVIEFNRHFSQAEQDKSLKQIFEDDASMPGIFTWLMGGWFKYRGRGLDMPDSLKQVVRKYQKDNDTVLQFLEDKCQKDPEGKVKQKDLYELYKIWCRGMGYYVMSAKKFAASLRIHTDWLQDEVSIKGYPCYCGFSYVK
jgi:putative DNA primase/helicase